VDAYIYFFQAESGIRDATVTGVQTCALPISLRPRLRARRADLRRHVRARLEMKPALEISNLSYRYPDGTTALRGVSFQVASGERSEERRVGKEWRCRWAHSAVRV